MKLDTEFIQLPLLFDAGRLAEEVRQFNEADWRPHPEGHPGNSALSLVSLNGDPQNEGVMGPMRPTPSLERCPYIRQILASFNAPIGRTRLMRIDGQADATPHVDTNYYWTSHARIHIPAITWPSVRFVCGARNVHMAAGEAWLFDSWRTHNAINPHSQARIHLVADTTGSEQFSALLARASRPFAAGAAEFKASFVQFDPQSQPSLSFEDRNFPIVMSPAERNALSEFILREAFQHSTNSMQDVAQLMALLERNNAAWERLWLLHADRETGWTAFKLLRGELNQELTEFEGRLRLFNEVDVVEALRQTIQRPALNPELAAVYRPAHAAAIVSPTEDAAARSVRNEVFDRPVFIVAAPRSGSTLLFETLALSPDFWTVGGESHDLIESIPALSPVANGFASNALTAAEATPESTELFFASFHARLRDRDGRTLRDSSGKIRMLEKTPKNALRIDFFNALFPDALFIYLYRDPRENVASMIEAWQSGMFVTYPELPGWDGPPWSLLLTPGWRELRGRSLAEIAAAQWSAAHRSILDSLERLNPSRWCAIRYTDLLAQTTAQITRLCHFSGVRAPEALPEKLPLSRHTLTPPRPEKWRRFAAEIEPVLPQLAPVHARAQEFFAHFASISNERTLAPQRSDANLLARPMQKRGELLRSVHTNSALEILKQLGASVLMTTGTADKLIVARNYNDTLNLHVREFNAPTGLAFDGVRLALGTAQQIVAFYNQPHLAGKLHPPGHDACFVPRWTHFTGDIRGGELAWSGEELWVVNTRFSCLCTLDRTHSFIPRWRPQFIASLGPEDRCHLNGLALIDGQPRYVTALGQSNHAAGWRKNKAGGCIIDVRSGEAVLDSAALPHSPRWHQDGLWFLEAGRSTLCLLDPKARKPVVVAELPGFTRGLDFLGPYAFVGLSRYRNSEESGSCGVWIIDVRNGAALGFIRFDSGVEEIFSVRVLPGIRMPEVVAEQEDILSNTFVLPNDALNEIGAASI